MKRKKNKGCCTERQKKCNKKIKNSRSFIKVFRKIRILLLLIIVVKNKNLWNIL